MRTYELVMQVVSYQTVEVQTEERISGTDLEFMAQQKLEEQGVAGKASLWLTKELTPVPRTAKERVSTSFKNLRKAGAVARMNYQCCSSCGWAALEIDYPNFNDDTDTAVFYHRQDADSFNKRGHLETYLYLAFHGEGEMIVQALGNEGLTTEWN
ncbi:MAG: hypothetical protein LC650_02400, partial [Actinobacteria bacterium]|nr:hypothetical protein [Actinomycetota bacterium]